MTMGSCKCPSSEITATHWHERFIAATCVCCHNGRLHAEENGRIIEVCGDNYANIDKVKVDGGLIPKGHTECCDFFFGHKPNGTIPYANNVFVELKGSGVGKPNRQIINTIKIFKSNGKLSHDSTINGVIVTTAVPKVAGSEISKFKKAAGKGGKLHIKCIKRHPLEYDIVNNRIAN